MSVVTASASPGQTDFSCSACGSELRVRLAEGRCLSAIEVGVVVGTHGRLCRGAV